MNSTGMLLEPKKLLKPTLNNGAIKLKLKKYKNPQNTGDKHNREKTAMEQVNIMDSNIQLNQINLNDA